ncbi:MAG: hypothetical protein ACREE0_04545 [Phenylobacterium sp.]
MPVPPPIDPRLLAAEIEATVAEFNRLCALAASMHVEVIAEIQVQVAPDGPWRPVLAVQVVAPL